MQEIIQQLMLLQMSLKKRLLFIMIASVVFAMIYNVGAESSLNKEDAENLKNEFINQVKDVDAIGIFFNNFRIAVAMFIPAIGAVFGLVAAYTTGMVFKALALTTQIDLHPLLLFLTPFGFMEIFSYGMAISQSVIFINAIIRKNLTMSLVYSTLIQVGIVSIILFVAAQIEYYMIKSIEETVGITIQV